MNAERIVYHLTGWLIDDWLIGDIDSDEQQLDELFDADAHAACTHDCSRSEVMVERVLA